VETRKVPTRSFRAEVGRLWVRRAFRDWPGCERRWFDLARGGLGHGRNAGSIPDAGAVEIEGGLLYVPPVEPELAPARDALIDSLQRQGVPMLVQLAVGETLGSTVAPPEAIVIDLLEPLLARRLDALDAVPRESVVVWPLVAALTDDEALWDEGCRRLRAADVTCVQAVVLELGPAERRELAGDESGEDLYSRLFHGRAASERRFAGVASRHGLDVFFRRRGSDSDRRARNAAIAELLALAGELWGRLGRGEVQAQELFRASRWVEDNAVEVRALAAEGNLEIVEALRPAAVTAIVEQWARAGSSPTVDEWLAEYVAAALP
jgi:hypothetical protein